MADVTGGRVASRHEENLWREITTFHARTADTIDRALRRRFGISLSEYSTLDVLETLAPDGIRMQDLADTVGMDQSAMSRLAARLERDEFVVRENYQHDRRGVSIRLTDKGRDRTREARGLYLHALASAFDRNLADPDLGQLRSRLGEPDTNAS
jgi:DNA-binding MarR family transcriptional regulator